MRFVTILLAVGFGMVLSWVMFLNPQTVAVRHPRLTEDQPGYESVNMVEYAVWNMAVWEIIFWSVAFGVLIGVMLAWSGGSDGRRRLRDMEYDRDKAVLDDDEPDYVVGLTRRK